MLDGCKDNVKMRNIKINFLVYGFVVVIKMN
jgi:hypothetical protein